MSSNLQKLGSRSGSPGNTLPTPTSTVIEMTLLVICSIALNDGPFKHDLDRYKYPERHGSDSLSHRSAAVAFLERLERRLACTPYLAGGAWGLTDAAIMPFIRQFAAVDQGWFDTLALPAVKSWLRACTSSNLFATVMVRPSPWMPGDAPVHFPS